MTDRRSDEELDECLPKVLIGGAERRAIDVVDYDLAGHSGSVARR